MNRYDGIDKRIVSNVKTFAKNLKRNALFLFMEIEDLEQELMYEIISCIEKFDERYGQLEHFVRRVLSRSCATLIETYTRKKRDSVIKFSEYSDEMRQDRDTDNPDQYRDLLENRFDISVFLNEMPMKHRLICRLLVDHTVIEISQILGVSRSSIYRDLRLIKIAFQHFENSKKHFCLFKTKGGKKMSKNLSVIETMNTKELSSLEVFDLADLCDQVAKLLSHAKELKAKLDDALNLRFSETVKKNLRLENKDTGTTKFTENGFQIVAEVPKKVTWDSQKIEEIIKTIPESHRRDYIKTTHSIDERIYSNFSYEYQQLFKPARTVTPGKTKFQIKLPEEV